VDLNLSEDEQLFVDAARAFLTRRCSPQVAREVEALPDGHDPARWEAITGMGWLGIALPESCGGSGGGLVELALLAEELGRAPCNIPLLVSTTLAALPLYWAGRHEQASALAGGRAIGTLALSEPGWRHAWQEPDLRGQAVGAGWVLTGSKVLVPYAAVCDLLLAAVHLEGRGLSLVVLDHPANLRLRRQQVIGADPLYEVHLDGAEVAADAVIASGAAATAILHQALTYSMVAAAAYAVGLMSAALDLSVRHASDRTQFGRPVGSFQAVAHRCVDIRTDRDAARLLVWQAAWLLDHERPATLEVAAAQAYVNDALRRVFVNAHQVHGAIGFTMEHDLQLYSRRAKACELAFGATDRHHQQVFTVMTEQPRRPLPARRD